MRVLNLFVREIWLTRCLKKLERRDTVHISRRVPYTFYVESRWRIAKFASLLRTSIMFTSCFEWDRVFPWTSKSGKSNSISRFVNRSVDCRSFHASSMLEPRNRASYCFMYREYRTTTRSILSRLSRERERERERRETKNKGGNTFSEWFAV